MRSSRSFSRLPITASINTTPSSKLYGHFQQRYFDNKDKSNGLGSNELMVSMSYGCTCSNGYRSLSR